MSAAVSDDSHRIGPYRIERPLGEGGMGQVFLGIHEETGLQAAVKILAPHASEEVELRKRFRREMSAAAAIVHPHVVRVYDTGQDGDRLYLAMEYLPFLDLGEVLKGLGPMSPLVALRHGRNVASALHALHGAGLIHRDLKPANLIVAEGERIVVVDFGLVHDDKVTKMTATGAFLGTPRYLPPEAFAGKPATPAWDVWQLGLIFYEMVTARPAWETTDLHRLMAAVLNHDVPSFESYRPGLPAELDALVARCCAKEPALRPDSPGGEAVALFDEAIAAVEASKSSSKARLGRRPGRSLSTSSPSPAGAATTAPRLSASGKQSRSSPSLSGARPATVLGESGAAGLGRSDVLGASDSLGDLGSLGRKWILGVLVLLLLLGGGGGLWWALRPRVYRVTDLDVQQGVDRLVVTWESDRPYRSRIEAAGDDGSVTLFEGSCDGEGRHRVELAPVKPGKTYRLAVLFPDETRSLPRPVKVEELRLRPVSARRDGEHVIVAWESNLPMRCKLVAKLDEDSATQAPFTDEGRAHEARLLAPAGRIAALHVEVESRHGGREIHDLGALVSDLCERLGRAITVDASAVILGIGFDENAISDASNRLTGKGEVTAEEQRQERRRKMAEIIRKEMETRGIFESHERLAPFVPLVLDEPFVAAERRWLMLRNLAQIRLIQQFCLRRSLPGDNVPLLDRGRYELRQSRSDGSKVVAVETFPDRGMRIEVFRPLTTKPDHLEWQPTLGQLPSPARPELGFQFDGAPPSGYFLVTVNGQGPILVHGHDLGARRRWVGFPEGWLKPGLNRIALQIKDLPGTFSGSGIWIEGLKLAMRQP